jgi:hypothetical protein
MTHEAKVEMTLLVILALAFLLAIGVRVFR